MTDAGFTPLHRGGAGEPLVLIHGITDTWRSWELVLARLERDHDVLAVTLPGHAGGPPLPDEPHAGMLAEGVERAMDEAGFEDARIAGNSLGGFVSFQLAERGRARSVVALAPAGGWDPEAHGKAGTMEMIRAMYERTKLAAAHADEIAATPKGRRLATQLIATNWEHIPADLIAHQIRGVAGCDLERLLEFGGSDDWDLDAERITCPVRVVWGTDDRILPWPAFAERYRGEWAPNADWIELDGIGHCPQLDVPAEAAELISGFSP